ncbi:amino acid permease, partial [Streptomyces sp. NPDC005231]|uniref:APC family permease n=1 Tax=Streptomyces sp. NPDC005231 TaxID=3157026 RepID=UPI0033B020D2
MGAILGPGVLVLPAIAAEMAGPASLLAWLVLLLFCIPVAASFAALGARFPGSGGVATFVARAFGSHAAGVVGYWFYFAVPTGASATAYIGGRYVAHGLGAGEHMALAIAAVMLLAAFGGNALGLRVSGGVQLVLVGLFAALLLTAVVVALPQAHAHNAVPFAPRGWTGIGRATSVLFFAFAGWEAVTHLSGEFRDPRRALGRVAGMTLVVIAVLYAGLAATCVLVLGPGLARTTVPLTLLMQQGAVAWASTATAAMAVLSTYCTMNAYLAGASRLGVVLARDGLLPSALAKGQGAGEVPRRSLALLFMLCAVVWATVPLIGARLEDLVLAASACCIAVTVAGLASGIRLLPHGSAVWWGAVLASVVTSVVLAFSGWFLLVPLAVGVLALGRARWLASTATASEGCGLGVCSGSGGLGPGCVVGSVTSADWCSLVWQWRVTAMRPINRRISGTLRGMRSCSS